MSWLPLIVPFLASVLTLFVPGLLIAVLGGLPVRLWGLAPALSVGVIAGSAVVCGAIGIDWNVATVLAVTLLVAAVAALIRWKPFSLPRPQWAAAAIVIAGVAAFGLLAFWRMYMSVVPGPDAIGQLQDTMFHIDVVRYILDNADGSSLHTGYMDGSANASGFYPAGWHDVTALVVSLTGVSIPIAAAAMSAAITILVFPLSSMTLVAQLVPRVPYLLLAFAGISAQLSGAFPWRFLSWGQLYSNLLAGALLPAVIGLLAYLLGSWRDNGLRMRVILALSALLALAGVALSQPNTVFALVIFGATYLVWFFAGRNGKRVLSRRSLLAILAVLVVVGGFWAVLYKMPFMQRTVTWVWPSFETPAQAGGEALLFGFNGGVGQPLLAVGAVIGWVYLIRRFPRSGWIGASAVSFGALYVLAAGSEGVVRDVLTGFWYHDSYRLAAFCAIAAVPLIAVAGWRAATVMTSVVGRFSTARLLPSALIVVVATVVLFAPGASQQREWIAASFQTEDAWMLSPEERDFLDQVAETVPADAVVLNNPYDGSGLAYGLNGVDVVFPAMDGNWLGTWGQSERLLAAELTESEWSPSVCAALADVGATYLLQLQDRPYAAAGVGPEWSGLRVPASGAEGFEPVLVDGEMALFALDGCD